MKLLNHKSSRICHWLDFHFWITAYLLHKWQSLENRESHFTLHRLHCHSSECFRNINECTLTMPHRRGVSSLPQRMNCGIKREQFVPCQMWHCHTAGSGSPGSLCTCELVEQGGETSGETLLPQESWQDNGTTAKPWPLGHSASLCLQSLPHFL